MNENLKVITKAIEDKFGADTVILDIRALTPMADYFVITSGQNPNQIQAIANSIDEELSKLGVRASHVEDEGPNWTLMDFGDIIVHIFDKESREFYDLERLWADAVKVKI